MVRTLQIGDRLVGPGQPCFLIAEAGVNHNGSLEMALRLVNEAAEAGADAVKFQTFRAEALVTSDAPQAAYQKAATGEEESQYQMLKALELTPNMHEALMKRCRERGVLFLSTPFDEGSADYLVSLEMPAIKVPSGEITNLPFLQHLARTGKPLIVSTGMATLGEVEGALHTIEGVNPGAEVALLQCVSSYPAPDSAINLRAMGTMAAAFGRPTGYSDHTTGIHIALGAMALGACIVEKHFTLDRSLPGPDQAASLEPDELQAMIEGIRGIEAALGDGIKRPSPAELDTAAVARKSLVAARDLAAGHVMTLEDIAIRRPGTGLLPARREEVVGRRLKSDLTAGTLLSLEMFS
jgi:N-acetylneuraminate synthase